MVVIFILSSATARRDREITLLLLFIGSAQKCGHNARERPESTVMSPNELSVALHWCIAIDFCLDRNDFTSPERKPSKSKWKCIYYLMIVQFSKDLLSLVVREIECEVRDLSRDTERNLSDNPKEKQRLRHIFKSRKRFVNLSWEIARFIQINFPSRNGSLRS